jgi:hypothetical protein
MSRASQSAMYPASRSRLENVHSTAGSCPASAMVFDTAGDTSASILLAITCCSCTSESLERKFHVSG